MSPHLASSSYFPPAPKLTLVSDRPAADGADVATIERSDPRDQQRRELADATQELLDRARSAPDDEQAELRCQAVTGYLWLADGIARRYRGRGEESEDLVQIARAGLVEAAQRYDARYGSFPSFAAPTVAGVLKRHFRDHGWLVRPPRPTQEAATQINRAWPQLAQELGAEPNDRAMAMKTGQSLEAVRQARLAGGGYAGCSLEAAVNVGSATDASTEQDLVEDRLVIAQAWRQITESERRLLTMRFFEDRSQSDIAVEFGTSQMQISRMLSRTFRKMRRLIAGTDDSAPPTRVRSGHLVVGGGRAMTEHRDPVEQAATPA